MMRSLCARTAILICAIAHALLLSSPAYSAFLRNVPQVLVQPNGDTLRCFATGDEFRHRLHDENNYTITQDPTSGYYVFASLQGDSLVASGYLPGKTDPASAGLRPGVNVSPQRTLATRDEILALSNDASSAPTTGILNNIVLFIQFNGEQVFTGGSGTAPFDKNGATYTRMFSDSTPGANSVRNYFEEVSNKRLKVRSWLLPGLKGGIAPQSITDSHPRAYYRPYNIKTNPIGYVDITERMKREHELLLNALTSWVIKYGGVTSPTDVDGNNDGIVDNLTFVVSGSPDGWGDLLWPHMSTFIGQYWAPHRGGNGYVQLSTYNFQLQTSLLSQGVGVLSHEMFHSLGAPDLYHYTENGIEPVAAWDIMELNLEPPQHMCGYMKARYGKWITIPTIRSSGSYTLLPGQCLKVPSPNSSTQYFVLEYRRRAGTFESSLPGSGLLAYRIDASRDGFGNAPGPPDEIYLYRPGGTRTVNGLPWNAHFCSDVGRTMINDNTNPSSFLSTGTPGGLNVSNIGAAGSSISFSLNIGGVGVTSTDETQGSMPLQYSLSQAYPNPFNPSTHIRYALPYKSHVHLSILNTLGQQVAVLVDSEVEAGVHEVQLNGSKLASGVYFCRIEANSWFDTKRIILMR